MKLDTYQIGSVNPEKWKEIYERVAHQNKEEEEKLRKYSGTLPKTPSIYKVSKVSK